MMRALLHWLTRRFPEPRVIYDRAGESPYLSRWYLYPARTEDREEKRGQFALFLHRFHRGDDDSELHSHPWSWSVALILAGGYREERRARLGLCDAVITRAVRPWTFNIIRADDFHRVDLYEEDAWSLFLAGPKTGVDWGFWDRATGAFLPWREFITRKRGPGWVES
jgi:hypothetical protein